VLWCHDLRSQIEPLPRILQDLRSFLQDPEWLQKFVDLDGLVLLIDNLVLKSRKFKKTNMDLSVEIECVKCLKLLLNDEYGLKVPIYNKSIGFMA